MPTVLHAGLKSRDEEGLEVRVPLERVQLGCFFSLKFSNAKYQKHNTVCRDEKLDHLESTKGSESRQYIFSEKI